MRNKWLAQGLFSLTEMREQENNFQGDLRAYSTAFLQTSAR